MGRSKSIPDAVVLDAILGLITDIGPAALTFARASQTVGLSPATLVQRYGDRDAMLHAALLHAWDQLDAATTVADAEEPVTPDGAIALLLRLMDSTDADRHATDGLLLLREDIRHPALRARGAAWGQTLATALGRRLTTTEQADQLGWQMATVWMGAQTWWAFTRLAPPKIAARAALETWLHSTRQARRAP